MSNGNPLTIFRGTNFIGDVQCDNEFVAALQRINNYAKNHDVQIYITDSFRHLNQAVKGAIVPPVPIGNHHAGHAIDMNICHQGILYNSHALDPSNFDKLPQAVKDFIDDIRHDGTLRWGGDFTTADPVHIDDGLNVNYPTIFQERVNVVQWANPLETPPPPPPQSPARKVPHTRIIFLTIALSVIILCSGLTWHYVNSSNPRTTPFPTTPPNSNPFPTATPSTNPTQSSTNPNAPFLGVWKTTSPIKVYYDSYNPYHNPLEVITGYLSIEITSYFTGIYVSSNFTTTSHTSLVPDSTDFDNSYWDQTVASFASGYGAVNGTEITWDYRYSNAIPAGYGCAFTLTGNTLTGTIIESGLLYSDNNAIMLTKGT